jgi:hypothetical protein
MRNARRGRRRSHVETSIHYRGVVFKTRPQPIIFKDDHFKAKRAQDIRSVVDAQTQKIRQKLSRQKRT